MYDVVLVKPSNLHLWKVLIIIIILINLVKVLGPNPLDLELMYNTVK